jgi:ATP synthase I subunit
MEENLPQEPDHQTPVRVLGRIRSIAIAAYVAFAVAVAIVDGWKGFVGLTCSALVTMISFLWLEEIVNTLLQSTAHPHARRLMLRTLARFVLLGAALLVTIFVARFHALSVLLGFSIVVVGIIGEALYSTVRSFAR